MEEEAAPAAPPVFGEEAPVVEEPAEEAPAAPAAPAAAPAAAAAPVAEEEAAAAPASLKRLAEEQLPVPEEEVPAPKQARVEETEEEVAAEAPAAAPATEEKEEAAPAAPAAAAPPPAAPPSSRALRIDNFVGAFSDANARALLSQHGGGGGAPLQLFWMPAPPQARTHCYAVFEDASAAAACERALAGMEWPAGACNALRPRAVGVEEAESAVEAAAAAAEQEAAAAAADAADAAAAADADAAAAAAAAAPATTEAPAGDLPKILAEQPLQWAPAEGTEGAAAPPLAEEGGAPAPQQG